MKTNLEQFTISLHKNKKALSSFSIKNIFDDKMNLRLFYFHGSNEIYPFFRCRYLEATLQKCSEMQVFTSNAQLY